VELKKKTLILLTLFFLCACGHTVSHLTSSISKLAVSCWCSFL